MYPPPNQPITNQPGFNPYYMDGQGQPYAPPPGYPPPGGPGYPAQHFHMNQYPPPQGYPGGPPPQQGPYYYGPQQQPPPIMGQPQGGGGMMGKVMGVMNEAVNPMSAMHSTGNALTGYKSPPMMPLHPVEGCPFGLELLLETEHIIVKQQVEVMEALLEQVGVPVETPNRYDILNTGGNRIYFAAEQGGLLGMQFSPSGSTRPFKITVADFSGRQILKVERKWSCLYCCLSTCNCCGTTGTEVSVTLGDGTYLGRIKQKFNWCAPILIMEDDAGNEIAEILTPGCTDCCCACCCGAGCGCDVKFRVKTIDGQEIGTITKEWSGFLKEQFTDADTFGVSFPKDMQVRAKAMLIAAVFLIDFMYFEENPQRNND